VPNDNLKKKIVFLKYSGLEIDRQQGLRTKVNYDIYHINTPKGVFLCARDMN
jgi:hypothetical protein